MATCSSILALEISWIEESGGLQSMGPQKRQARFMIRQQQISFSSIIFRRGCLHCIFFPFCHQFSSVQFSLSVMSNSLRPHGLQSTRPPCPSSAPRVCPSSYPLNQLCFPTIQCVPYWIRCSLNSVTDVLIRGEEHRDAERRWLCEYGGRDWRDVATSQGTSRVNRSWKKQERIPP